MYIPDFPESVLYHEYDKCMREVDPRDREEHFWWMFQIVYEEQSYFCLMIEEIAPESVKEYEYEVCMEQPDYRAQEEYYWYFVWMVDSEEYWCE